MDFNVFPFQKPPRKKLEVKTYAGLNLIRKTTVYAKTASN
jgi:hypothetical protein